MKELIPVRNENGELLVSARDLHKGLGIGRDFTNWVKFISKYGFEEDIDYTRIWTDTRVHKNGEVAITGVEPIEDKWAYKSDYLFKLDMAKEVCMIQRTDKGREFRKYFIDCEKRLKTIAPSSYKEAVKQLLEQLEENERLEQQNNNLQIQLDESKDYYSIKRVAFLNNISWKTLDWRKLKRESNFQGRDIVKIFDANYGEVNTYHRSVWEVVYPNLVLK